MATVRFRVVHNKPNQAISIREYSKNGWANHAMVRVPVPVMALKRIFLRRVRSSKRAKRAIRIISMIPALISGIFRVGSTRVMAAGSAIKATNAWAK
jgi:hypothetical protein